MVQAARSGVQNIAEGSVASGTSKKTELKLTNVAKASLEELRLDYEDFLRQRGLAQWAMDAPIRQELIDCRLKTADEVAVWIRAKAGTMSTASTKSTLYAVLSANATLVLINVACGLLGRQIATLAESFENEGGFTERLYNVRKGRRTS